MKKLISSALTLGIDRETQRLPPGLGRKWPRKPGWTQNRGYPVLRGRWVKIGGSLKNREGAPLLRRECQAWIEAAYGMLQSIYESLLHLCPVSGRGRVVWLARSGATASLRVSKYNLLTRKFRRYDFQRKKPVDTEEQWINLPIGNKDPSSLSVIVIEDKKGFDSAS